MKRVMDDEFKTEHQVTIGVEFGAYNLTVDGKVIKIQIWDTAGQESFKSVTRIFYRGAHCVFLTYDITRDETFVSLGDWLKEIKQHASEDVLIYLVGNKAELESEREITFDRAIEYAKSNGIHKCFETSAKSGLCVEEVFSCGGKNLYQQIVAQHEIENAAKDSLGVGQTSNQRRNSVVSIGKQGGTIKKEGGCCWIISIRIIC